MITKCPWCKSSITIKKAANIAMCDQTNNDDYNWLRSPFIENKKQAKEMINEGRDDLKRTRPDKGGERVKKYRGRWS